MINFKLNKISNIYLFNFSLAASVMLSIIIMFYVQFKVDNLQDKVSEVDAKILAYEDEIRILEVEWVYLTRPERLRILSDKYLQDNDYIVAGQVKDLGRLEKFYTANLQKEQIKEVAMNAEVIGKVN